MKVSSDFRMLFLQSDFDFSKVSVFEIVFVLLYVKVVRKIWFLTFFFGSMLIAQEVHRIELNLHLRLYSHSVYSNSWSLIILPSQWVCQVQTIFSFILS